MKASYLETTGPPDVLKYGDLPDPSPGPNDVLIRVRASSLNRVDVFTREGSHGTRITPPHVLGLDLAGEVIEIGSAVTRIVPGYRVLAIGQAGHAEYAVCPAAMTFPLPAGCSFDEGAALPTSGLAAYTALIPCARLRAGEDVLVIAAASGVGHLAIQIAKAAGARVITTAGTAEKLQRARAIGAYETINHYSEDIAERVLELTAGQGVDVVVEQVGTPVWSACVRSLKPYGRFVTCGVTAGHKVDLHLGQVFVRGTQIIGIGRPDRAAARESMLGLLRLVSLGRVRPIVHARFPLEAEAEAHRLMESSNFFGKLVLNP